MKEYDRIDVRASFKDLPISLGDNIYRFAQNCSDLVCLKMQIKIIIHHFIMK